MAEWYYSQYGQTKGPVSEITLVNKVLQQELEVDDYIMQYGKEVWLKIKDVPGLMEKIHAPLNLPHQEVFPSDLINEGAPVRVGNIYFYIPIRRFILMSIFSVGLYQFYWMYKQWQYFDRKSRLPYQRPRGLLTWIFFPWTIFREIQYDTELNMVARADFSGVGIFWLWIGAGVAIYLVASSMDKIFGKSDLVYYIIGSLDVLVLLPIQRYINVVNAKLGNTYEKPGMGHYICLVLGILTLLSALGLSLIQKNLLQAFQP